MKINPFRIVLIYALIGLVTLLCISACTGETKKALPLIFGMFISFIGGASMMEREIREKQMSLFLTKVVNRENKEHLEACLKATDDIERG
jgi:hypothetical protein